MSNILDNFTIITENTIIKSVVDIEKPSVGINIKTAINKSVTDIDNLPVMININNEKLYTYNDLLMYYKTHVEQKISWVFLQNFNAINLPDKFYNHLLMFQKYR